MPQQAQPGSIEAINGLKGLSFAEARVRASLDDGDGVEVRAFKSISWKQTVTVGKGYSGGRPDRRSSGQIAYANAVTLWPDGMVRLYQRLATIAAERGLIRDGDKHQVGLVEWDLILIFEPPGGTIHREIVFHKCRLTEQDETSTEGEAIQESPHVLDCMDQWEQDPENPAIKWVLI